MVQLLTLILIVPSQPIYDKTKHNRLLAMSMFCLLFIYFSLSFDVLSCHNLSLPIRTLSPTKNVNREKNVSAKIHVHCCLLHFSL